MFEFKAWIFVSLSGIEKFRFDIIERMLKIYALYRYATIEIREWQDEITKTLQEHVFDIMYFAF